MSALPPIISIQDQHDANVLNEAAVVLKRRSRKPNGFWMRISVKVLTDIAADIRSGKTPSR